MWSTWLIVFFIVQLIHFLGTWSLYQKAGRKAWEAAVPVYNAVILLKIIERPWWWVFVLFIPIVAPIMYAILWVDTARCFGKRERYHGVLAVGTLGFYLYYLNYIEKPGYTGPEERVETVLSGVLFAVILATIIHTFFIQPYTIPTSSMEKTLLVGDFLFVSKVNYGSRLPFTPVAIPFTQSKFFGAKSYLDKVRLPYYRFPGFKKVQKNDIVVFNYPTDSINTAIDRKDPYVKRCVGLPGEIIEVKDGIVFADGIEEQLPKDAARQFNYIVDTGGASLRDKSLYKDIQYLEPEEFGGIMDSTGVAKYLFRGLTKEQAQKLRGYENVKSVTKISYYAKGEAALVKRADGTINEAQSISPINKPWNADFYGPIRVPKKGDQIALGLENFDEYKDLLNYSEGVSVTKEGNKIFLNGKPFTGNYTVKQDYYLMMGDNRNMSLDGRFFGFVGENHVLGEPVFIWLSINNMFKNGGFNSKISDWKINFDRLFTIPNNNEYPKKSFLLYFLGLLGMYFAYDYWKNNKKKK